jgi:hypothetical protein
MRRGAVAGLLLAVTLALGACASTDVQVSGQTLAQPLCGAGAAPAGVSVLWGPMWRPDQKEPPLREAAALKGIQAFFGAQPCISPLQIHRVDIPPTYAQLSGPALMALARAQGADADRVILLVVRELGPKLFIGLPTLIEGGTEVVLETLVADRSNPKPLAQVQAHWFKGGPFYIKGVKSLDQDMHTVLGLLFDPQASAAEH